MGNDRIRVEEVEKNIKEEIIDQNIGMRWLENEEWLKEEHPEKYEKRMNYRKDKKTVLEKVLEWITIELDGQKTVSISKLKDQLDEIAEDSKQKGEILGSIERVKH